MVLLDRTGTAPAGAPVETVAAQKMQPAILCPKRRGLK